MLNDKELTFVIQGSVIGLATDNKKDRHTYLCLKSIRKHFPNSYIIFSTWRGSDVSGLDFDLLVENEDPGISIFGDFSKNGFRQIVSSIEGLKKVKTKYAIKVRSDLIFKNRKILKYFNKFNKTNILYDYKYKIVEKRVLLLTTCNPRRRSKFPFNASDWLYLGLTKDVINIFDIPLIRGRFLEPCEYDNNKEKFCESPYSAEQYIWFGFLSKYKEIDFKHLRDISNNNIEEAEKYFANNAILATAKKIGIDWLKYPGAAYAQKPCLSNSGLYTFTEYKKMLNKYTPNKLFIFPNILESFIYSVVYNLRFFIKKRNKKLHDAIAYMVNRKNHIKVKKMLKK